MRKILMFGLLLIGAVSCTQPGYVYRHDNGRGWYKRHPHGMPPGQARKLYGNVPPGQAKKRGRW